MSKEKILILFNGEHLAYSPTVIQLYDELSKQYDVTITAEFPHRFDKQKPSNRKVIYHRLYHVRTRYLYFILFQFEAFLKKEAKYFKDNKISYKQYYFRYKFIKNIIRKHSYKAIISVDISNLLFCSIMKLKTDFLSLELCADEKYLPLIDSNYIRSVIIQTWERYEYLFQDKKLKTFFVQNAPDYIETDINHNRKGTVYSGTACDEFGFYHCLNFLNRYPAEKLTVQGAVMKPDKNRIENEYKNLIKEERLLINKKYLENSEVVPFLSDFEIGFCFYNFDSLVIKNNYFNYATAPSGKMFKYLAAGVPVVGINIIGFNFVKEFHCGILVNDLLPETIKKAIDTIRANYQFYVDNSIKAAKHFSFGKSIQPYLDLLASN